MACRGCKANLTQLHTVDAPHVSPVLFYVHYVTITQTSQFRDGSRIMQASLIGCLPWIGFGR